MLKDKRFKRLASLSLALIMILVSIPVYAIDSDESVDTYYTYEESSTETESNVETESSKETESNEETESSVETESSTETESSAETESSEEVESESDTETEGVSEEYLEESSASSDFSSDYGLSVTLDAPLFFADIEAVVADMIDVDFVFNYPREIFRTGSSVWMAGLLGAIDMELDYGTNLSPFTPIRVELWVDNEGSARQTRTINFDSMDINPEDPLSLSGRHWFFVSDDDMHFIENQFEFWLSSPPGETTVYELVFRVYVDNVFVADSGVLTATIENPHRIPASYFSVEFEELILPAVHAGDMVWMRKSLAYNVTLDENASFGSSDHVHDLIPLWYKDGVRVANQTRTWMTFRDLGDMGIMPEIDQFTTDWSLPAWVRFNNVLLEHDGYLTLRVYMDEGWWDSSTGQSHEDLVFIGESDPIRFEVTERNVNYDDVAVVLTQRFDRITAPEGAAITLGFEPSVIDIRLEHENTGLAEFSPLEWVWIRQGDGAQSRRIRGPLSRFLSENEWNPWFTDFPLEGRVTTDWFFRQMSGVGNNIWQVSADDAGVWNMHVYLGEQLVAVGENFYVNVSDNNDNDNSGEVTHPSGAVSFSYPSGNNGFDASYTLENGSNHAFGVNFEIHVEDFHAIYFQWYRNGVAFGNRINSDTIGNPQRVALSLANVNATAHGGEWILVAYTYLDSTDELSFVDEVSRPSVLTVRSSGTGNNSGSGNNSGGGSASRPTTPPTTTPAVAQPQTAGQNTAEIVEQLEDNAEQITLKLQEGVSEVRLFGSAIDMIKGQGADLVIEAAGGAKLTFSPEILEYMFERAHPFSTTGNFVINLTETRDAEGNTIVDFRVSINGIEMTHSPYSMFNIVTSPIDVPLGVNPYKVIAIDPLGDIIGGTLNTDDMTFAFDTHDVGEFTVMYVEDLARFTLDLGATELVNLAQPADGNIAMDVMPIIENDRALLPIRFIAYALGADVGWDEQTSSVTLFDGETNISFAIGELAEGMDVPASIVDGRTMVPLRFIAEVFGATVNWDDSGTVEIIRI